MTSSKGAEIIKIGWLASGIRDAVGLLLKKLTLIDALEELDWVIVYSEDVIKSNTLRLTAITCLAEDELEILGSRNVTDSDLSDDDECAWVAQIRRGAFDLFEDKLVYLLYLLYCLYY